MLYTLHHIGTLRTCSSSCFSGRVSLKFVFFFKLMTRLTESWQNSMHLGTRRREFQGGVGFDNWVPGASSVPHSYVTFGSIRFFFCREAGITMSPLGFLPCVWKAKTYLLPGDPTEAEFSEKYHHLFSHTQCVTWLFWKVLWCVCFLPRLVFLQLRVCSNLHKSYEARGSP